MRKRNKIRWIPLIHGIYFSITALWPLVHIGSFMSATGYKTDTWLVKAVSILLLPLVIILFSSVSRARPIPLSHSAAVITGTAGLAAVEFIYYFNGTLFRIYLADAILEMFFLLWWITVFMHTVRTKYNTRSNQF